MLAATSFQITLLSGKNWVEDLQLYVLGGVFLAATAVWYPLFRLRPSVWVLTLPWLFFGLAFFMIGLPSVHKIFVPAHKALASAATWSYAVGSAAAFAFFGLNFGEEAVSVTLNRECFDPNTSTGCCHGGLDVASLHRPRFPANLGRCTLVLGQFIEWSRGWLHSTLVDRVHPMALSLYELDFRILDDVGSAR